MNNMKKDRVQRVQSTGTGHPDILGLRLAQYLILDLGHTYEDAKNDAFAMWQFDNISKLVYQHTCRALDALQLILRIQKEVRNGH